MAVLSFTNLGIYAIAGTSVVIGLVRNLCFTIPMAAKYLGFKWHKFYIGVGYSIVSTLIVLAVGFGVKCLIIPNTWLALITVCAITAVIALVAGSLFILNRQERAALFGFAKVALRKVKG